MSGSDLASVVPAQLAYLTIYNPLLGPTDETIQDQVVFYTSRSDRLQRSGSSTTENENKETNDGWNVRLRQIGLAQGMVSFARNFSKGQAVDYVETDKSLIVVHELEKNWWILASIDLTRLPTHSSNGPSSQRDASEASSSRYSSREMCPSHHLIQQLRRAHSIFLLHHDITLDALYERVGRATLCPLLENFWLRFAWNWDILLSGNPAVDVYNGIKLSAGGELGIGVGEEEWGSGEREVLEDFVIQTDGLVDIVVSRFGDPNTPDESTTTANKSADGMRNDDDETHWLGLDTYPRPSDGVIFSGVGAISRSSVVRISQWMEWIYRYGIDAYGVGEDPTSPRRRKHRRRQRGRSGKDTNSVLQARENPQSRDTDDSFSPGIPRPLVMGTTKSMQPPQGSDGVSLLSSGESSPARSEKGSDWVGTTTGAFVKYLTLGYGSSWSMSRTPSAHPRVEALKREDDLASSNKQTGPPTDEQEGSEESPSKPEDPPVKTRSRAQTFYLYFSIRSSSSVSGRPISLSQYPSPTTTSPRVTQQVNIAAIAAARISVSGHSLDINQRFSAENLLFYDLVYDPTNLTIRSSIPNIPDLGFSPLEAPRDPSATPLSRVESLNIHHRLLSTYIETRSRPLELERTCKTSRGWWIVWVRMSDPSYKPTSDDSNTSQPDDSRQEAFLIRKGSDYVSTSSHARNKSGTRFFRDLGGASSPGLSDMGPAKLAEGLGLDARRYIESLLNLNR
ncbi:hypothetical protein ABOM_009252 [Aspergillus bombycis]|uniref:CCZ1/INTU/HSP4 first Longin domain-containing protein n=1 Tax=Aspergillus bombycis TaxID=109264 RepID=A0A1F7ZRN7_9EURO|nr:hypothetical protein ABOM_009252 [Aspergillus bombycis]OGM41778.1 hypothetical protein ABOM_009252 [Aspergillus bombycis]